MNGPTTQDSWPASERPEILSYVEREGERWIVVWFPEGFTNGPSADLLPDAPYWWRQEGRFIDRSEECS